MRARWAGAILVATLCTAGSGRIAGQSLDGAWSAEGYGLYLNVSGATLKAYELTAISCLPSFTAERVSVAANGDVAFAVVGQSASYLVRPGGSADRWLVHRNGAASDIVIRRLRSAPSQCERPIADTPLNNFDVFARTWAEQYGFFDVRKADWRAITLRQRARVNDRTTPQELFQILKSMIEPLEDAHTGIAAGAITETFRGTRKSEHWLEAADRTRAFEITERHYIEGALRSWCNGQVQYGRLASGIGYLRLKSFSNFGAQPGFESGSAALDEALDAIFADAPSWRGLVIDMRINSGGSDAWGLSIASRLTASPYIAYSKQARADPEDASRWTDPQPSEVRPSSRASFHGPVVELTGIHSVSAAETFTQALLARVPHVTRVGENTQGVFSDVLTRRLPNGWTFGLPNERFVTDGQAYDGTGIAPDVEVAVFPQADLDEGRDGALEKALELLGVARQPPGAKPVARVGAIDRTDLVASIAGRALVHNGGMDFLRTLVDSVGPRVTGTDQSRAAAALIRDTLQQAGLRSVHVEDYQFHPRWQRGAADVRVTRPVDRMLIVGSYGWVPGTRGRVDAPVVDLGRPPARDVPKGVDVNGAAVLVDVHDIGDEPLQVMRAVIAQQLARAGAVAMLIPSDKPNRMVYTSGWGFYPRGALPVLSIAREDALLLRRLLGSGPVTLSLTVHNTFDDATATERNVVAEIPGRDPQQVVVVGAHFDSWDFADGADDNGSGVACLVEAARILNALHVEPQATIRFVFFSGEEQANLGSRAYVQRHADELDATRAFLMMDDGAQLPLGFKTNGRSELVGPLETLLAPLDPLGAGNISDGADLESDNASFMAVGVPTLTLRVAQGDYDVRHHAIADTFDRIDPHHIALDTAVMATAAYLVANADARLGRRQSLEQVRELFERTGLTSAQELLFGPLSR